jgi:hypothetical protein
MPCSAGVVVFAIVLALFVFWYFQMRKKPQGYPWSGACAQWCREEQPYDPTCLQRCLRTEAYAVPQTLNVTGRC